MQATNRALVDSFAAWQCMSSCADHVDDCVSTSQIDDMSPQVGLAEEAARRQSVTAVFFYSPWEPL